MSIAPMEMWWSILRVFDWQSETREILLHERQRILLYGLKLALK